MVLKGRVALITGAARGIGRAIALRLAKDGADVAVNDIGKKSLGAGITIKAPDLKQLDDVADEIKKMGRRSLAVRADVTKADEIDQMVKDVIAEFGKIDILVNNAGVGSNALILEMTEEQWDRVLDVNLKGVFLCCKAVVPHMMSKGYGKIINMGSPSAEMAVSMMSNYCVSKYGLKMFSCILAKEVAAFSVRVNTVYPACIPTDIWSGLLPAWSNILGISIEETWKKCIIDAQSVVPVLDEQKKEIVYKVRPEFSPMLPMNDDDGKYIAALVAFLASPDGDFITGKTIGVDGGFVMNV